MELAVCIARFLFTPSIQEDIIDERAGDRFARIEHRLDLLERNGIAQSLINLERTSNTMDANVKRLVDDVAVIKGIGPSIVAALGPDGPLMTQIADLKQQIADLKAAGGVISPEDVEALTASAQDLEDTTVALRSAIPSSSPPATS